MALNRYNDVLFTLWMRIRFTNLQTQGSNHVLFTLSFWAGSLLLITFYHILKLLRKIDREIKMLKSEKLLEENQSQLFRIEEMLEIYSDLRSSHQENAHLLEREQQHNQEFILQLSATSHDLKTPPRWSNPTWTRPMPRPTGSWAWRASAGAGFPAR